MDIRLTHIVLIAILLFYLPEFTTLGSGTVVGIADGDSHASWQAASDSAFRH